MDARLPGSPFIDPLKCDPETVAAHMLRELNLMVPFIAREIRDARELDPAELLFLRKEFAPIVHAIARR
jgi:hypothetical protein